MDNNDYLGMLKTPPYCRMSEQTVIGGILIDPAILGDLEDLAPDHFYERKHTVIFEAIREISNQGSMPDIVMVSERLNEKGQLDDIGFNTLVEYAQNVPSLSNMNSYAMSIMDKALERNIILASNRIYDNAYEAIPTEEKLSYAQAEIMALSSNNSEEARQINAALKNSVEGIDYRSQNDGMIVGLPTGFTDVDKRTQGFVDGNLIVVAGRPGMGKTTYCMNIAEKTSVEGGAVLVFSMEMPEVDLVDRLLSSSGSVPLLRIRTGKLREEEWPKLSSGISKLKDKPLYIDDRPELTPNQMRSTARKLHKKIKIRLVVVDYIQLARFPGAKNNREQEVSEVSRSLKSLAKELSCPVMAIAQLNRDCEKRMNKRPVPSDLRDSGSIEQDADIIQFCYRDEVYNEHTKSKGITEIITGKFRNGVIGTDYLKSNLAYNRFENLAAPYQTPPPDAEDDFEYGDQ